MASLNTLFVDNHLLFLEKPAGLPVVPDQSGDESLLERARAWVGERFNKPGNVFLGVVHRLDRPVSGVIVFARTSKAAARLTQAFREQRVSKVYLGVSSRAPERDEGELTQWLRKDRERNTVTAFESEVPGAKLARTRWRVVDSAGRGAKQRFLVELHPVTGRSHQLRVAMASLGAPLLGDLRYGASAPLADKSVALHARSLTVPHPTRGEDLCFGAEPPALDVWRF